MARVLIVDDDPFILEFLKDLLEKSARKEYISKWDLQIQTARDGSEALSIIKENNYELIITDILMAKMDGFELIKEIRKKFPEFSTPVIVMSAVQGVDLEYESRKHGASAWFTKPIKIKEFTSKVFTLICER
jgi:two-component system, sensor histidine kinase ChiS